MISREVTSKQIEQDIHNWTNEIKQRVMISNLQSIIV